MGIPAACSVTIPMIYAFMNRDRFIARFLIHFAP
jgi:hypothetical protein